MLTISKLCFSAGAKTTVPSPDPAATARPTTNPTAATGWKPAAATATTEPATYDETSAVW